MRHEALAYLAAAHDAEARQLVVIGALREIGLPIGSIGKGTGILAHPPAERRAVTLWNLYESLNRAYDRAMREYRRRWESLTLDERYSERGGLGGTVPQSVSDKAASLQVGRDGHGPAAQSLKPEGWF